MKVLVINCGSSSIKYRLFDVDNDQQLAVGLVEKIGEEISPFKQESAQGELTGKKKVGNHIEAFQIVEECLLDDQYGVISSIDEIVAVGHRVVHGGEKFVDSTLITDEIEKTIEDYFTLAPLHNPPNLTGIKAAKQLLPNVPHVAVFDTSFHATMPKHAYRYAIPNEFYLKYGIRRYGFHGTSHRFVSNRAAKYLNIEKDKFNCITCHLGNGCSITAVKNGKSVDTSMGMTPLEGVVMGTRSGDIDPAVPLFMVEKGIGSAGDIDTLLNKKSGLLGVSQVSNDLRTVKEAADEGNDDAALALDIFAYRIKKYIGAYMAALGRVDAVVFTGGIGENAFWMREKICAGLENVGITLASDKNTQAQGKETVISADGSQVTLLVVPTNEELVIARDTYTIAKEHFKNHKQ